MKKKQLEEKEKKMYTSASNQGSNDNIEALGGGSVICGQRCLVAGPDGPSCAFRYPPPTDATCLGCCSVDMKGGI